MKRKNPYILVAIIWAVLTVALQVASVVCYVEVNSGVGAILGGCAVGFAFTLGTLFQQAKEISEWNRNVRFLEQAHEALTSWVEERQKAEENRPFKEFDKPSEVPFEEVRNKENADD